MTWFGSSILGFANHRQYVDTRDLASNYLLICWSNDLGVLIKVVVHDVVSKLRFRPKVQFGPEVAQTGVPPSLLRCPPRVRRNGEVAAMHQSAPTIADARPSSPAVPLCPAVDVVEHQSILPILLHSPSVIPISLPRSLVENHGTAAMASPTAATGHCWAGQSCRARVWGLLRLSGRRCAAVVSSPAVVGHGQRCCCLVGRQRISVSNRVNLRVPDANHRLR